MSAIQNAIETIIAEIGKDVTLVAVSKTKPSESVVDAYAGGQRVFGENKVQELVEKESVLPKDIEWHLIGHLQTNKVKYVAPFVTLIHAVDSLKLLKEINKQAAKSDRVIDCLLQVKIASEDSKFGLSFDEISSLLEFSRELTCVRILGLMGMATNTEDENQVKTEFSKLRKLYDALKVNNINFRYLSMGMTGDYKLAIQEGSNMVRIGSAIFGSRV